jgi:uncharacterized membrane protein YedE/YeeE
MASLLFVGKRFGMSTNLRTMCSIAGAGRVSEFFRFDYKSQIWGLIVVVGAIIGGYIATNFLTETDYVIDLNPEVIGYLDYLGFKNAGQTYLPTELFDISALSNPKSLAILIIGGFLVGFGTRYAGGCTSGHAISGLSNLQRPSLIAVIGFFMGGLVMVHLIFPSIF